ncbi:MAG: DMT family transporter [Bacillota bacterium]|nr:DMT family transporter [Bacillota bacterium]
MTSQRKADISLFLVTIGWGISFLLTKNSLDFLETYNFLAIRFLLAFFISFGIFYKKFKNLNKKTVKYGIGLGVLLFLHYALQTVGLNYTTVSKSAFITGLNVIMVPVFSALIIKTIPERKVVFSTIIAFTGLGLLTLNGNIDGVNIGDVYTFLCALVFALYIILVGKYTVKVESISFATIQLGVVGILSLITSFMIETPIIPTEAAAWGNIVFLSVVCTSGAYIVQNVAQKFTSPSHTALIYTGEPVFAAFFGYIFLEELLSFRGTLGALMILSGMLIVEVNFKKLFKSKKSKAS